MRYRSPPEERRASPQQTQHDRRCINQLERELHRKEKALAEAAELLALSIKIEAIFNNCEAERSAWKITDWLNRSKRRMRAARG